LAVADVRVPDLIQADLWVQWRQFTPARIALGRVGVSQPTKALLSFSMAHASARDAVYEPLDLAGLAAQLAHSESDDNYDFSVDIDCDIDLNVDSSSGPQSSDPHAERVTNTPPAQPSPASRWIPVHSRATDRAQYLRRPDLGRRLDPASRERLVEQASAWRANQAPDLVFVIADGLSALATSRHAVPVISAVRRRLAGWRIGPIVIAEQARVALGDEVGECLHAGCVAILIGERPGLSSPDSLGIYLTWRPQVGRSDAERNCISNIRPAGLSYEQAAIKLAALLEGAKRLGATGVELKDDDRATDQLN
jgi:ethanolamine ammonia-lyase small subunit